MSGKKTAQILGGVVVVGGILLVLCAGVGAGGYFGYTSYRDQQERDLVCLEMREAARQKWLEAVEVLAQQQQQLTRQRAEHEAALERAALIRDLEATDRYEGLISATDNRLTSLALAQEAVDEMQTALLTLPAEEIAQKARLLSKIPLDESAAAVLEPLLQDALQLEASCD